MLVSICVCTYRRPELLGILLPRLLSLPMIDGCSAEVVVVDNDPERSAYDVWQNTSSLGHWPSRYYNVTPANISLARNKILQEAAGEFLLFIDDDEIPDAAWAQSLLAQALADDADCVLGPVIPTFPASGPPSPDETRWFERPRQRSGSLVHPVNFRTSNLLLRNATVKKSGSAFDLNFGNSGGEDYLFICSLADAGAKVIWCDEALVYEEVAEERRSPEYIIKRAANSANNYIRAHVKQRRYRSVVRQILISFTFVLLLWPLQRIAREACGTWGFRVMRRYAVSRAKLKFMNKPASNFYGG